MYCRFCGKEIEDESVFCKHCGKKMEETATDEDFKTNRKVSLKRKILIGVIGAFAILLISATLFAYKLLGTKIVKNTIEAGSDFDIGDYVHTVSKNAVIVENGSSLNTSKLGKHQIAYTVKNGSLSIHRKMQLKVVDTTKPVITGMEKVIIGKGEEFDPENYYQVKDIESSLNKNIKVSPEIDSNKEGKNSVELSVKDSSGNIGKLKVNVVVADLSEDEQNVIKVINQYNEENVGDVTWGIGYAAVDAVNGVQAYVYLPTDIIYAIYATGDIKKYTEMDAGSETMFQLLEYAILEYGTNVNLSTY